ncbi:MAG: hypothetical protein FWG91_04495 [Lachnospiraceae bacterium]|nr:hypothetical protein [Lachnospiraceae bacterium]
MIDRDLLKVLDSPWVISIGGDMDGSFGFELKDGAPKKIRKQFERVLLAHYAELSARGEI